MPPLKYLAIHRAKCSLRNADTDAWKSQVTADYVVTSQNGWDAFSSVAAARSTDAGLGFEIVTSMDAQTEGVGTNRGPIDAAKLQLDYSRIRSPLNGRAGTRLIDAGLHGAQLGGTGRVPDVHLALREAGAHFRAR